MSVARWVRRRPGAAWHAERPHRVTEGSKAPCSQSWCGRPVVSSHVEQGPPVTQLAPTATGLLCRKCIAGIVAELARRAAERAAREALEPPVLTEAPWQRQDARAG